MVDDLIFNIVIIFSSVYNLAYKISGFVCNSEKIWIKIYSNNSQSNKNYIISVFLNELMSSCTWYWHLSTSASW